MSSSLNISTSPPLVLLDACVNALNLSGAAQATLKLGDRESGSETEISALLLVVTYTPSTSDPTDTVHHDVDDSTLSISCGLPGGVALIGGVGSGITVGSGNTVSVVCNNVFQSGRLVTTSTTPTTAPSGRTVTRTFRFAPTSNGLTSIACSGSTKFAMHSCGINVRKCRLQASGAANVSVVCSSPVSSIKRFRIRASGASRIDGGGLRARNVTITASGASSVCDFIITKEGDVGSSGASNVTVGKRKSADVDSSSGGASNCRVHTVL